jgi:hypothetical protein
MNIIETLPAEGNGCLFIPGCLIAVGVLVIISLCMVMVLL